MSVAETHVAPEPAVTVAGSQSGSETSQDDSRLLSRRACGEGHKLRADLVGWKGQSRSWETFIEKFKLYLENKAGSKPVFVHSDGRRQIGSPEKHSYGPEYSNKRYGRVLRGERELLSQDPELTTALITLTCPAFVEGEPIRPIERFDVLNESYQKVYKRMYDELKTKRGVNFEYVAVAGPTRKGNALGHSHWHIAVYVPNMDEQEVYRALAPAAYKHLSGCSLVDEDNHPMDRTLQIRTTNMDELEAYNQDEDLGKVTPVGRYVMGHMPGLGTVTDVRERDEVFVRHSALSWSRNVKTYRPSDLFKSSSDNSSSSDDEESEWNMVGIVDKNENFHKFTKDDRGIDMKVTGPLNQP